jgi:hypothetical protein
MKYISVIFLFSLGIGACRKSNDSSVENNGRRLTSIVWDSAGTLDFAYNNNVITGIRETYPISLPVDNSTVQYANTGSNELVSVAHVNSGSPSYSFNYKLNSSKLPLLITESYTDSSGTTHVDNIAEFTYVPNTDILDSVDNPYRDTVNFIYKFDYSGQNISKITEWQKTPTRDLQVATFQFTYDSTENVFRQTDSLLYIYNYPNTVISGATMVIASFFAETFSKSTFNSMATWELTNGLSPYNSYKITHRVNSKGKITSETFINDLFVSIKKYTYI